PSLIRPAECVRADARRGRANGSGCTLDRGRVAEQEVLLIAMAYHNWLRASIDCSDLRWGISPIDIGGGSLINPRSVVQCPWAACTSRATAERPPSAN